MITPYRAPANMPKSRRPAAPKRILLNQALDALTALSFFENFIVSKQMELMTMTVGIRTVMMALYIGRIIWLKT